MIPQLAFSGLTSSLITHAVAYPYPAMVRAFLSFAALLAVSTECLAFMGPSTASVRTLESTQVKKDDSIFARRLRMYAHVSWEALCGQVFGSSATLLPIPAVQRHKTRSSAGSPRRTRERKGESRIGRDERDEKTSCVDVSSQNAHWAQRPIQVHVV